MTAGSAEKVATKRQTADLGRILGDLSTEVAHLGERCAAFQWAISALLDKVDHPDLGAEIHMLQDIDRVQQTLTDIAAILGVSHTFATRNPIQNQELWPAIRLESLRQRLGLSNGVPRTIADTDAADVTWF